MGGGRWEVGGGRWEVGDGRWEMGGGRWEVGEIEFSIRHLKSKIQNPKSKIQNPHYQARWRSLPEVIESLSPKSGKFTDGNIAQNLRLTSEAKIAAGGMGWKTASGGIFPIWRRYLTFDLHRTGTTRTDAHTINNPGIPIVEIYPISE